ncbi:hypothetical protein [Belnapia sp. F-4-1]|uniref:hypothetical protein n=1 Tax=Belnapia sp. F-4-1 TaxID=1545443 RepID=UPI001186A3CB|nr:hypothetical protein [Belnapia sp. F-4-1]
MSEGQLDFALVDGGGYSVGPVAELHARRASGGAEAMNRTYPDKATFKAELDRLTGFCLKIKVAAQKLGIEVETAALQAFQTGQLTAEDYEMVRLALGGNDQMSRR